MSPPACLRCPLAALHVIMQSRMQLVPGLHFSRSSMFRWCRAATAAVCKKWAALHDDSDSRIWEAVSVDCERAHALKQRGEGSAGCLYRWLSARAPGLRQISFCDGCTCAGEDTGGEVGDGGDTGSCRTSNGTNDDC